MHELTCNLHMHTRYSDSTGLHRDIARAALRAGLDVVIVTDHNVWVQGFEGYYREAGRRVLMLVGEEIHDQDREPQKNHLLVLGADRELATLADDPQALIDAVRAAGGLSFLAHPVDPEQKAIGERDISWVDRDVRGFTGVELWNAFSEFKGRIPSLLHALFYVFFPQFIALAPFPGALQLWDEMLSHGRPVAALAGSDAHALQRTLGPLRKVLFPYEFHFRAINTHLLVPQAPTGDLQHDRAQVLQALEHGHAFIGNDSLAPTRGFRFSAQGRETSAGMGEEISASGGLTLQARLPGMGETRLLRDGRLLRTWQNQEAFSHTITDPGVYRVEVYRRHLGRRRGWIFSNPIYVK